MNWIFNILIKNQKIDANGKWDIGIKDCQLVQNETKGIVSNHLAWKIDERAQDRIMLRVSSPDSH